MHFCAIHLDDLGPCHGEEEVYVVVPDAAKTAMAVPLDALPAFLPVLEHAVGSTSFPRCPACQAELPRLRVCRSHTVNRAILGNPRVPAVTRGRRRTRTRGPTCARPRSPRGP